MMVMMVRSQAAPACQLFHTVGKGLFLSFSSNALNQEPRFRTTTTTVDPTACAEDDIYPPWVADGMEWMMMVMMVRPLLTLDVIIRLPPFRPALLYIVFSPSVSFFVLDVLSCFLTHHS
mmetsp:Transcript_16607/g.16585  ORF Transcript_16607/g.16585 Transcript_16607/m.16585 type:complete len:119 (-) Transcript_16607:42-398(-)